MRSIVPHEEKFLRKQFGEAFDDIANAFRRRSAGRAGARRRGEPGIRDVIARAESRTFAHVRRDARACWRFKALRRDARVDAASCCLAAIVLSAFVAALEFWGGLRREQPGADERRGARLHGRLRARARARRRRSARSVRPIARRTFGYGRIEVLGALVNGTLLLVATVVIVVRSVAPLRARRSNRTATTMTLSRASAWRSTPPSDSLAMPATRARPCAISTSVRRSFTYSATRWARSPSSSAASSIALTHRAWIDPAALALRRGHHRRRRRRASCATPRDVLLESVAARRGRRRPHRPTSSASAASPASTTCTSGRSAAVRTRCRRTCSSTIAA